jgi:hypothetical protein
MNVKSYFITPESDFFRADENPDFVIPQATNMEINNNVLEFDNRFLRIVSLLREIHQFKNQSNDFSLSYLVELFQNEASEKNKSILIKEIKKVGYEKLKDTFEKINMECECYLCETENLFGILKRHQFKKEIPDSDSERLKQIIQFLHISLIHINILHNRKNRSIPDTLKNIKIKAFETIEPFVNKVEEILSDMIQTTVVNSKELIKL